MRQLEAQAKALAPVLSGLLNKALAGIRTEISEMLDALAKQLRSEIPAPAPIEEIAKQAAALVPAAKPIDIDAVAKQALALLPAPAAIADIAKEAAALIPAPAPIEEIAKQAAALVPTPKPGADGKSVTIDEVMASLEGLVAKWALEFERRAQDTLQRAVDRLPVPKDGLDGLGFDDLNVEYDGAGGVTLRFMRGDQTKEFAFRLPVFVDCGVFKEGGDYQQGNGVTFGGCFWIAQKDHPQGKPGNSDDWRLAVKKGRDGRDAGDK